MTAGLVGAAIQHCQVAEAETDPDDQAALLSDFAVDGGSDTDNPGFTISADELGVVGAGGAPAAPTNTRPRECAIRAWNDDRLSAGRAIRDQLPTVDAMTEGERYYVDCTWLDDNTTDYAEVFTYQPAEPGRPGPNLAAIARRVSDEVPLTYPAPATSPAIDGDQITGLPTWLWIDPAGFETLTAERSLAGITVTVTATPRHVTWDLGDGTDPITCTGPGTPYQPGTDRNRTSDCSHLYQHVSRDQPDGAYDASVTTTWTLDWTATTAAATVDGGTFPDIARTTTFSHTVTELQAVVEYHP
jgi:hypothetical protein